MKFHANNIKKAAFVMASALAAFTACNHAPDEFDPIPTPMTSSLRAIGDTLRMNAGDSLFYRLLVRSGQLNTLNDKSRGFTVFVPGNAAVRQFVSGATGGAIPASGLANDSLYSAFISNTLSTTAAAQVVLYHMLPQAVPSANIPTSFPNMPYPTFFNPSPSASPFLRLDEYISKRTNGAWLNNIPIISPDRIAGNGVIHGIAAVSVPPSRLVWSKIDTAADLTYFKAAIQRADSGAAPGTSIQRNLLDSASVAPGLNLTVFAPTDDAMRAFIIGSITQYLISTGADPVTAQAQATGLVTLFGTTILSNPASIPGVGPQLAGVLTPTTAKGIVVYHIVFGRRIFTPNIPTVALTIPTYLNSAIPAHEGITIGAAFAGPVVSSATVKGKINTSASNVLINPLPGGSSDQHFVNGVLHKIDQVLRPL